MVKNGQHGQKWSKRSKMVRNGPQWSKIVKNGQNGQNGQKWLKVDKNGLRWSKMVKIVRQTGLSAQRARRTKSRGPKGLQLEVRVRRAPRLLVFHISFIIYFIHHIFHPSPTLYLLNKSPCLIISNR